MECNLKTREKLIVEGYVRNLGNLASIYMMGNETVQLNDAMPDDMIEYDQSIIMIHSAFFDLLVEHLT